MKRYLIILTATGIILLGSISGFASEIVTVDNFVRAETDMTLDRYVKQGAFGKFLHIRNPTPIDKQDVIRMNRDTLYSAGVFDLTEPVTIKVDNGTEFTSRSLDAWAYWNRIELDSSRPGKPGDNAHIEAFNSIVRRECLSQHWFTNLEDARQVLEAWRRDYNEERPHGGLGREVPARYRAGTSKNQSRNEARESQS